MTKCIVHLVHGLWISPALATNLSSEFLDIKSHPQQTGRENNLGVP